MKRFSRPFKALLIAGVFAALTIAQLVPLPQAQAATPNVAVGAGQVVTIPIFISGQRTATTASVVRFAMPFPCDVLGVGASARASGGTTPTLTVDVLSGGTTILSAPIAVTAGAYAEGTVATAAIPDENAITVNLAITGTTPTWDDITVLITVARK